MADDQRPLGWEAFREALHSLAHPELVGLEFEAPGKGDYALLGEQTFRELSSLFAVLGMIPRHEEATGTVFLTPSGSPMHLGLGHYDGIDYFIVFLVYGTKSTVAEILEIPGSFQPSPDKWPGGVEVVVELLSPQLRFCAFILDEHESARYGM